MDAIEHLQLLLLLLVALQGVISLDNGLGRTPQMGWNSWNGYHCNISQSIVESTADALVSLGLDKLGYVYVNVDDCWAKSRDSKGVIQPDKDAFPDFEAMIDYVHSKGLLFGLYSDAGLLTCAGRPGSLGHEETDAETYKEWKVDYLKYDNCYADFKTPQVRYPVMRDALNKTSQPIFLSLCEWGVGDPATWAPEIGNSWRTTHDIEDTWSSMIITAFQNDNWAKYAAPGGWNDPDMLEIGNGGMSTAEYETHMSLWCLMKAPLLIGCDVTKMNNDTLRILSNPEVIAINQDPMGVQGTRVKSEGTADVWAGPLDGGCYVVLLLNRGDSSATIKAEWNDFGLDNSHVATVRDLWMHADLGKMNGSVSSTVPSHGVKMYKITPL